MALATDYISAKAGIAERSRDYFAELFAKMQQQHMYRQTVNSLNGLSDRQLTDLGLKRSEIRRIAHQAAIKG